MPTPEEKRRHARRPLRVLVNHSAKPAAAAASDYATDLSEGGFFLKTQRRTTLGELLYVEIPSSQGQPIRATCEVARVTPEGIGAHFTQLDNDSALLLNLLLSV